MSSESSVRAQVALSLMPRLNNRLYLPFIERCGGIEGFFMENEKALALAYREFNLSPEAFNRQSALRNATEEIEKIDQHAIRLCSAEHGSYPELLAQCEDAPIVFFHKGNLPSAAGNKFLAIVGTRHASARCQSRVESIVEGLCAMGHRPVIVSGLAFGIDASAHRASLKYNLTTLAVLGHGLHMIYPATHKGLAHQIVEAGGALISEYPCTATTHPSNFLRRNRIIAGLCHATLVAESAEKGGAMATARLAMAYNRDVMALAGRPEDTYSKGCNLLIKENIAALTENSTDLAQILHYTIKNNVPQQTSLDLFEHGEKETCLINILTDKGSIHIDELCQLTGIPSGELSALLLQLELEGKVLALPGKNYSAR